MAGLRSGHRVDGRHLLNQFPVVLAVPRFVEVKLTVEIRLSVGCVGYVTHYPPKGCNPAASARVSEFGPIYSDLRTAFMARGAPALLSQKRGPKTNYRRTAEVVRQVIRHRFLDPEASAEVIAQKLCQSGWQISIRSVQRVIEEFGLQKKTLPVPTEG